jgi:hypothetical protein
LIGQSSDEPPTPIKLLALASVRSLQDRATEALDLNSPLETPLGATSGKRQGGFFLRKSPSPHRKQLFRDRN